jgi:hypothetical protein
VQGGTAAGGGTHAVIKLTKPLLAPAVPVVSTTDSGTGGEQDGNPAAAPVMT